MHDGKDTLNGNGSGAQAAAAASFAPTPSFNTIESDLPTSVEKDKPPRTPLRRKKKQGYTPVYDPIVGIMGALISTLAAGVLWWIGAILTLTFIEQRLHINLETLGAWRWLIPVSITGIEVAFWPRANQSLNFRLLFFMIAAADLGTSVDGGRFWIQERGGAVWLAWVAGSLGAFLCAFWPERLIRSAVEHFWSNGKLLLHDLRLAGA